ncbi:MAG: S6e family ribosomal protein [Candidatus Micrarchaeia archaeon]
MKIVYSDPKSGRSAQIELAEDKAAMLYNFKIGDIFDGALIDLNGYKFRITGGSDASGFPMDNSVQGTGKVKVLKQMSSSGRHKGEYKRTTSRGNTVTAGIAQVNMIITEYGEKPLDELFPKGSEAQPAKQ